MTSSNNHHTSTNLHHLIDQFAIYLQMNKNCSAGTVENYTRSISRLVAFLNEKYNISDLREINQNHLEMFLGTLHHVIPSRDNGKPQKVALKPTTRHNIVSGIRQFFRWAVKYRYIDIDVSANIENPKLDKLLPKSLSAENATMLLDAASRRKLWQRDYLIALLFLILGMRVSELVGINESDIDYSAGVIVILGKGQKERELTLTPKTLRSLKHYLPIRNEILAKRNQNDNPALFINEKRGTRITRRGVEKIIEEIARESGIRSSFRVSPHKLRHTCATLLYNEGDADLLAISTLLGHEDPSTSKIYTNVNREKLRSVIESNPLNF